LLLLIFAAVFGALSIGLFFCRQLVPAPSQVKTSDECVARPWLGVYSFGAFALSFMCAAPYPAKVAG